VITMVSGGGASEVTGSFHNYIFDDNLDEVMAIDCGGRPVGFSTDIAVLAANGEAASGNGYRDMITAEESRTVSWPNLEVVPRVRYCLLSHGHLDHVLAAVLLAQKHRDIVLYGTNPTQWFCKFHWDTTLRFAKKDVEKPFSFDYADMEHAVSRFQEIPALDEFVPPIKLNDAVSFIPVRAGHILGAASFFIVYRNEVVGFHSGDIATFDQRTVWGAPKIELPTGLRFMVIDGTRITEAGASRETAEEEFKQKIGEWYCAGKSIRILSFSIGRTQECYELVREACPHAPIWIDGAGRDISTLYLEQLPPGRIDPKIKSHFVRDWEHRRRIIVGGPNIVLVPSAMQFGGCAMPYIRYGISRRDHVFVNPGWLDPCSPEYAFFEGKRGQVIEFRKNGEKETVPRFCEVARFNLTAHWSGDDALEAWERMKPEKTIIVHSDPERVAEFIAKHPGKGFITGQNEVPIRLL